MDINKTLISTALLTAIFEKTKKGNVDLMAPFILYIISEGEEKANDEYIKKRMEKDFSFLDFPHVVLKLIIKKLKKEGKIEQLEYKYHILPSANEEVESFKKRMERAQKESKKVMDALISYLKENTSINIDYTITKKALTAFLDKYGYIIYNDFELYKMKLKSGGNLQFFIGKFIENEYQKKSEIFTYLKNNIEGLMLANVIYLQIDTSADNNLNKLDCYFDSPFLLRIIKFKSEEDNKSAEELIQLLKKLGARIKCFRHSFNEVQAILRNYIENENNGGKTLEALDLGDYSEIELFQMYMDLENIFNAYGITIEEKPNYEKEKFKKNCYEDEIDEKKLKEILIERYTNKNIKDRTIGNDIDSVAAIFRLRESKRPQKLEDCKAIFITSNYDIRDATRQLLNINEKIEISPVISDIDLTTIVWLRTLEKSPNIPQDKLIENARAAMKPTTSIIDAFNKSVKKIKNQKYANNSQSLNSLIYSTHFASKFMDEIKGDENRVNARLIVKVYEETESEIKKVRQENINEKAKNLKLELKNNEIKEEFDSFKKQVVKNINEKYDKKIENIGKWICKSVEVICTIIIWIILICILYFENTDKCTINKIVCQIIYMAMWVISILSTINIFYSLPFIGSLPKKISKKIYTSAMPKISAYYRAKQKDELNTYYKENDDSQTIYK